MPGECSWRSGGGGQRFPLDGQGLAALELDRPELDLEHADVVGVGARLHEGRGGVGRTTDHVVAEAAPTEVRT